MHIAGVIIPGDIEDKIWRKHRVMGHEVRELFANRPAIKFREKGKVNAKEDLYTAWGQTSAGRYLIVFFIYKLTREALILSAREMIHKERKSYAKIKHQ